MNIILVDHNHYKVLMFSVFNNSVFLIFCLTLKLISILSMHIV